MKKAKQASEVDNIAVSVRCIHCRKFADLDTMVAYGGFFVCADNTPCNSNALAERPIINNR
jgi:hypothetical protein